MVAGTSSIRGLVLDASLYSRPGHVSLCEKYHDDLYSISALEVLALDVVTSVTLLPVGTIRLLRYLELVVTKTSLTRESLSTTSLAR